MHLTHTLEMNVGFSYLWNDTRRRVSALVAIKGQLPAGGGGGIVNLLELSRYGVC